MSLSAAGIIFSNLNNNNLSRLTGDRTVAAIPFACRYRLVDFCLSNFVNANVSNINIVANYNYRSLMEHIGSGKDWDLARRSGGINIISPFLTTRTPGAHMFSTHLEALKNMSAYIREIREEYIVLMDSDHVMNIDVLGLIREHADSGADITVVTRTVDESFTTKTPKMFIGASISRVEDIATGDSYSMRTPELSLNVFVMRTTFLRKILEEAEAHSLSSLTEMLISLRKSLDIRVHRHNGYVASVSSFLDYYSCSMQILTSSEARDSLFSKKGFPIYTRVHNSAPTLCKNGSFIENSMIADECIIEGTVINSVVFRGVRIAKGAVVKNSVLFRGTYVDEYSELDSIVTDKDVHVTRRTRLAGNYNMPFYIQKGRKV